MGSDNNQNELLSGHLGWGICTYYKYRLLYTRALVLWNTVNLEHQYYT